MRKKEFVILIGILFFETALIYAQPGTLDDNFFDNATQYDASESVSQDGDNYSAPLIDPNYVDPNFVPTTEKQISENVELKKKPFGLSFSQIADKTVKNTTGSDSVNSEDIKKIDPPAKTEKVFGFSFSQMANFTVDEESPTLNAR
tara:strand:+ start:3597 stop:4034 length:438 start_codon:yes stop_codon:yes gene_type:complete